MQYPNVRLEVKIPAKVTAKEVQETKKNQRKPKEIIGLLRLDRVRT